MNAKLAKLVLCFTMVLSLGVMARADVIDVGAHESEYVGFSRGYSYTAPVDHTITQMMLPSDLFITGDLASFLLQIDGVVSLYETGLATDTISADIDVLAGQEVLVLGNWTTGTPGGFTAKNSYNGTSPYASSILGNAVDLFRAGYQSDIADGSYVDGAGFTGLSGSHGRIFVTTAAMIPEPASFALLASGSLALLFRRRRIA